MSMLHGFQCQLNRNNDKVYESTTSVVRAVMTMTKEAPTVEPEGYLTMVRVSCLCCLLSPTGAQLLVPIHSMTVSRLSGHLYIKKRKDFSLRFIYLFIRFFLSPVNRKSVYWNLLCKTNQP